MIILIMIWKNFMVILLIIKSELMVIVIWIFSNNLTINSLLTDKNLASLIFGSTCKRSLIINYSCIDRIVIFRAALLNLVIVVGYQGKFRI